MLISAGAEPFCADADFVQVREPGLDARALARLARSWMTVSGAKVLVNDRTDVAIACGAAGIHLRDRSISPARVRRIAPPGFVISVACHDGESVLRAASEGADYAVLAPIFAPLSKAAAAPPLGLDALRSIAVKARIPVIALGGITAENAPQCIEAGAAGVAGITMFRS
jgi:thiamine-phosphate pyrophosphorylase